MYSDVKQKYDGAYFTQRRAKFMARRASNDLGETSVVLETKSMLSYYNDERIYYFTREGLKQFNKFYVNGIVYNYDGTKYSSITAMDSKGNGDMVVCDHDGNIFIHQKIRGKFHHSSFFSAANVAVAAVAEIRDGIVVRIDFWSGHYNPGAREQFNWNTVELCFTDLRLEEFTTYRSPGVIAFAESNHMRIYLSESVTIMGDKLYRSKEIYHDCAICRRRYSDPCSNCNLDAESIMDLRRKAAASAKEKQKDKYSVMHSANKHCSLVYIKCGHGFHACCWKIWAREHEQKCPMCNMIASAGDVSAMYSISKITAVKQPMKEIRRRDAALHVDSEIICVLSWMRCAVGQDYLFHHVSSRINSLYREFYTMELFVERLNALGHRGYLFQYTCGFGTMYKYVD